MPDTRYKDNGYRTELSEMEYGAFITVFQGDRVVAELSIAYLTGGAPEAALQLQIMQHRHEGKLDGDRTLIPLD